MAAATRASAPWTRTAWGADEDQGRLIVVKATRHGRRLSFAPAGPGDKPGEDAVAACVLQRESFTKWLTAALPSPRKAERVFPSLLDVQLPFSIEDCRYALVATSPTPDRAGTRGLVAGARHPDIEKRLAFLQTAGIDPHVLDQDGLALWSQACAERPAGTGASALYAVVYLGTDRTTLALGKGNEFLGAHSLRQADTDSVLRLLKSYPATASEPLFWLWTGPLAAQDAGVEKWQAGLAARRPNDTMKLARDPETFLARALATRALTAGPSRCNLRSGPFTHPFIARQAARAPYRLAIGLLVAGLMLVAVNLTWRVASQGSLSRARDNLRRLAVETTGSPRLVQPGMEVLSAQRALEAQTALMAPFTAAVERPLPAVLGEVLTAAQAEGLALETLTVNRRSLMIYGYAPQWANCERALTRLRALGAEPRAERKDVPSGESRTAFVIGMEWPREK
jgi:hypothetical protein